MLKLREEFRKNPPINLAKVRVAFIFFNYYYICINDILEEVILRDNLLLFSFLKVQRGAVEGDFAASITLYHAYELLLQHGMRAFFNFLSKVSGKQEGGYEIGTIGYKQCVSKGS